MKCGAFAEKQIVAGPQSLRKGDGGCFGHYSGFGLTYLITLFL